MKKTALYLIVLLTTLFLFSCYTRVTSFKVNIVGSWKLIKVDLYDGPKMIGNFYDGIVISFSPDSTLTCDRAYYDTLCWKLKYDSLSISRAKGHKSVLENGSYHIMDNGYNIIVLQNDSSLDKYYFMKWRKEDSYYVCNHDSTFDYVNIESQ